MNEVLNFIAKTYYSLIPMMCLQLITSFIGITKKPKFSELKYFEIYLLAGFFQIINCIIAILFFRHFFSRSVEIRVIAFSISIFSVIEFLTIYSFMFRTIVIVRFRKALKILFLFFLVYVSGMWIFTDAFFANPQKILLVENVIVLIPTTFYFLQLFRLQPTQILTDQPAFWINIGVLFLFTVSTPLFILDAYLRGFINRNFELYSINNICYSIFYILIWKAYMCNPEKQKAASDKNIFLSTKDSRSGQ